MPLWLLAAAALIGVIRVAITLPLARYGSDFVPIWEAVQRYTYEVIYNSWAYFPCTVMYRFGAQGLLTPEEIADVVAYLLDPESDFNTKPAVGSK